MPAAITAVFRDGAFHPTDPPALPDGATVRLVVVPDPPPVDLAAALAEANARLRVVAAGRASLPTDPPDPEQAYLLMKAIAEMPEEAIDDPALTNRDHDKILYGGPGGVR